MRKNKGAFDNMQQKRNRVVLLVGDVQGINRQLIQFLESIGNKVIISKDGMDALDKLRSVAVDLIITRLILPTMDCLEFIMNLKDLGVDSPLVIVTEHENEISANLFLINASAFCYTQRKNALSIATYALLKKTSK